MEFKKCVEEMKVIWEQDRPFRTDIANEVYQTLISFCETALKLQESGMPKKKFPAYDLEKGEITVDEATGNGIYNQAVDEMVARLASRMNVERIAHIIKMAQAEVHGTKIGDYVNGKYRERAAAAIVKDILEGKE